MTKLLTGQKSKMYYPVNFVINPPSEQVCQLSAAYNPNSISQSFTKESVDDARKLFAVDFVYLATCSEKNYFYNFLRRLSSFSLLGK